MMSQHSESLKELAAALAKTQGTIRSAVKDAINPHFGNRYADLPAIWDACRAPLTSNGLSIVQMPVDSEPGRVALTTLLLHTSGEWIESTVSTRITKDDPQGVGLGLTYLRRYALAAMVGIVADIDDDGNGVSELPATPVAPRQAPTITSGHGDTMTPSQRAFLDRLGEQLGWNRKQIGDFIEECGYSPIRLLKHEASDVIERLKAMTAGAA